jgi:DNA-binding transcriptional regulator YdaS (Cro superfamily)
MTMTLKEWLRYIEYHLPGHTQKKVAKLLNMTPHTLNRIVNGKVRPSVRNAYCIEKASGGRVLADHILRKAWEKEVKVQEIKIPDTQG